VGDRDRSTELRREDIATGLEKMNEYLLAMKCLAARPGDEENPSHDLEDALWLARHLGIKEKAELLNVLHRHFPERPLPDRTGFFLRELVARLDPPAS